MRSALIALGALAIIAAAVLTGTFAPHVAAATGPIPLNCNRACLEDLVNQYLAALVAHDPKRLPLSADAMYTENDQTIEVGDGFWKTAEAVGNYKHYFADPEFGQVVFMGSMREASAALLMSLRLRVELGRITEIESIYYRQGGGGPSGIADMDKPGYKPEGVVQFDCSRAASLPPGDDRHRRWLFHRPAEKRRQRHQWHGHLSLHQ